jgi:hypothetical protein
MLSRGNEVANRVPQHINDDVLHTFVTIAIYDTIGRKLCDRYGGVVTNCEFSIAVKNDGDRERLRQLASDIQSESCRARPAYHSRNRSLIAA